jgi:hypothetical protein
MGVKLGLSHKGKNIDLTVFFNRVPRRIFQPKREKMAGSWRRLNNKELHHLYNSPSIIRVTKSRRMRLAWHVV